ncbi:MarR family winged helix-turn-helix transcriptional regulator [Lactobacillus sp. ESL0791]|uniref:MarR family winged helix-turn-helix transcriptional regulator n=1 Tax=Lactobacillus sp. ESL0791 TaxID=2983234 RepID=UPI0023F766CB|nr:MarR family winged helix-turn-helix transcriptional regulator [Lactobacillus sp. ESL0791]MDF7638901.1 MarR family winged helix-turn-helix transcriptional regulator [Lactobacillus sp. ESL0791]
MDILAFSNISTQITKEISVKCGLNISQTRLLLFFEKNNNASFTMGNLAALLKISLSTLSRQLQQKRTQELVQITRSERDSSKTIMLNNKGLAKAAELRATLVQIENVFCSLLSPKETSSFNKELTFIAKNASKIRFI